jgi:hypothetical protein
MPSATRSGFQAAPSTESSASRSGLAASYTSTRVSRPARVTSAELGRRAVDDHRLALAAAESASPGAGLPARRSP